MEFCSNYGYAYMNLSDEEEFEEEDKVTNQKKIRKIRKADTNIIGVNFKSLSAPNEMFAGEPKFCKKCRAVISNFSKSNIQKTEEKLIWKCEYCFEANDLTGLLDDMNEIPHENDVTYILDRPEDTSESINLENSNDNSYLTFCVDVSGSMDTYIQIKETKENGEDEYKSTQTSRLQGVKIAAIETLSQVKHEKPNRRVALLTFSDAIKFYADSMNIIANKPVIEVAGEDLLNEERLLAKAHNVDGNIKNIIESHKNIEQRMKLLRTEGCTALGPALLFSIGFASKQPGSSVILCTDGCANVGLGSIENANNDEAIKFYDKIANYAKEKSVVVNIISMEGTDCRLALLGRVADKSNGSLNIVNPFNLSEEFKSIIDNKTVATNVTAKLIVNHKYLYIRNETLDAEEAKAIEVNNQAAKEALNAKKQSIDIKEIGNANIDTEITYEYGFKKVTDDELEERPKEFLFQLQVTYTAYDGTRAMRVYTKKQEFTKDRQIAEANVKLHDLLYIHGAQQTAQQVLQSNISASKFRSKANRNLLARTNVAEPSAYVRVMNLVEDFGDNVKAEELNDQEAKEIYHNSKLSKTKAEK